MEMIFECNEKPVFDKSGRLDAKMINLNQPTFDETKIPTELRQWLKDQMREIENKTLDEDKTKKILDMLDEWKHTGHADEYSKIIDELKEEKKVVIRVKSTRIKQLELLNKKNKQLEEKNKQLEEKNKQLEMDLEKMTKRKQAFLEGYKNTLEQLDIERIDWRGKSKLICANACMKNCNHIKAWFKCNHTMCIESAKYCGQCIECGKKPTDMRQWLKEIPTNE